MEDIVNGFSSEEEENEEPQNEVVDPLAINPADYEELKIIQLLQNKGMLLKEVICNKCNKKMKLEKNAIYLDKFCWRCRSQNPLHDIKLNIRKNSIYEDIKSPINALYYLTFNCFMKNMSINKSTNQVKEFCKALHIANISNKLIIKLYRILRAKIKRSFHSIWSHNLLALEPAEDGHPSIEIDESSIIGNSNSVIWVFGIIDRSDKQARLFCVMNNRTKQNLLPLIKNNVNTIAPIDGNNEYTTRVYSDCFSSYQERDFTEMNFILHRVNHSVWFGRGSFHTNTVEGLWSCIKRLSNNFSGLNFHNLSKLEKEGINSKDYIDDWLCYSLFLREIERKKLNEVESREYLLDILKIN